MFMADVWSIKGITTDERARITRAAEAADVPIGRHIVRACQAFDATQPLPQAEREAALARFERMARLAFEISGTKDQATRMARRTLTALLKIEAASIGAELSTPSRVARTPPAPMIEGRAD
jgi:hypothetical protein